MPSLTDSFFAVIVTYHPDINNLLRLVKQLSAQNIKVIIVDNTGKDTFTVSENDAILIRLAENQGIAAAQNYGIQRAIDNHANYIFFFDQDSTIDPMYTEQMWQDWQQASLLSSKPIAAIGPRFIDSRHHFFYKIIKLNAKGIHNKINVSNIQSPLEVSLIISSGSLVPVSALQDIGLMKEALFIDYVDTEWCLRASAKGYAIFVSSQAVMQHAIGDKIIPLFGFHIPVHSAFRRYFRIRNAFWLARIPHVPKLLAWREIIITQLRQIILIAVEKNKRANLQSWWRAIRDGLQKRI